MTGKIMKTTTLVSALTFVLLPLTSFAAGEPQDPAKMELRDLTGLQAALDAGATRRQSLHVVLNEADAQQKAINFLGSEQAHRDAIASLQQCRSCHDGNSVAWVLDAARIARIQPQGPWIGISVGPADGVLRSQLRLPDGTGVVVTRVVPNGPAQQSGVEEHDVLLSVNDKPVAGGEDLDKILQSAMADKPLTLKLLRRGQTIEKQVTPRKSDADEWLQSVVLRPQQAFRIGIQVSDPDETLKRQLNLTGGVVVTEVAGDKPADAAGVKSGDILLSVNGNPITGHEELPEKIQASGGSPVELELIRGGVRLKLSVTPVKEEATVADPAASYLQFLGRQGEPTRELMLVQPQYIDVLTAETQAVRDAHAAATQPTSPAERLRQITAQL